MKNFFLTLIFTMFMGAGFVSCQALENFFGEDMVFTTADQVVEGAEVAVIPFDQLPILIQEQIPEGSSLVLASREALVEGATFVPAGGEMDAEGWDGMFQVALGLATTFVPGLAAWEGVLTLFSRRKRQHYIKAVKAVVPTDRNIDLGGMFSSIAAGMGVSHSSVGTELLHAEEEEDWDDFLINGPGEEEEEEA